MAQRRPVDIAVMKFYGAMIATTVVVWGVVAVWVGRTQPENRGFPFLNVAFCVTWVIGILLTVVILEYAKRREVDRYVSWAEATAGATFAFFLMFWVWGVVPHQWLTFADNELSWRADKALIGPTIGPDNQGLFEWLLPFDLTYLVVRDVIVVAIYGITIAGFVAIWAVWQDRGKVAPVEIPESTYGRPLVKGGV